MSLERRSGGELGPHGAEPVGRLSGTQEIRRVERSTTVALGTLACPVCDAPVWPSRALRPAEELACPVCDHTGRVRDFLSLEAPTRAAHVVVRVTGGQPVVRRAPGR